MARDPASPFDSVAGLRCHGGVRTNVLPTIRAENACVHAGRSDASLPGLRTRSLVRTLGLGSLSGLLIVCVLIGAVAAAPRQERIEVRPRAPEQAWRIQSFAEDAGLTEGFVFQAVFEDNGIGWFAAGEGLFRYDGYRWRRFGVEAGLPSEYVRCVTITTDGQLWVGTDAGAGTFANERFEMRAAPEQLAGPSVRRIVEGPEGALWFCCDRWPDPSVEAGLSRLREERWTHFTAADGLPDDYVSNVAFDSVGTLFALTRAGLAELGEDGRFRQPLVEARLQGADEYAWSLIELEPGRMLVASSNGFFERVAGSWVGMRTEGSNRNRILLAAADGQVLGLPHGSQAFVSREGDQFVDATQRFPWKGESVQDLVEAPDGSVWAVGGRLLLRWDRRAELHSVYEDVPQPRLVDGEGAIWFADKKRVVRRLGDAWWTFPDAHGPIASDGDGGVWMANAAGAAHWTPTGVQQAPPLMGIDLTEIVGVDARGVLWVLGTEAEQWFALGLGDGEWHGTSLGSAANKKPRCSLDPIDGGLWVVFGKLAEPRRLVRLGVSAAEHLELSIPVEVHLAENTRAQRSADGSLWLFGYFGAYRRVALSAESAWERVLELSRQHVNTIADAGDSLWFVRLSTSGGHSGLSLLHEGVWTQRDLEVRRLVGWGRGGGPVFAQGSRLYRMQADSLASERVVPTYVEGMLQAVVDGGEQGLWVGAEGRAHLIRDDRMPPETILMECPSEVLEGGRVAAAGSRSRALPVAGSNRPLLGRNARR